MYLTYEDYKAMGGTLDETTFNGYEAIAEVYMDNWTLNRLHSEQVQADMKQLGYDRSVKAAMFSLVGDVPSIQKSLKARADGSEVTSFSNGVNSFSFGGSSAASGMTSAESVAYANVVAMLPIDLTSACVSFNHAG